MTKCLTCRCFTGQKHSEFFFGNPNCRSLFVLVVYTANALFIIVIVVIVIIVITTSTQVQRHEVTLGMAALTTFSERGAWCGHLSEYCGQSMKICVSRAIIHVLLNLYSKPFFAHIFRVFDLRDQSIFLNFCCHRMGYCVNL